MRYKYLVLNNVLVLNHQRRVYLTHTHTHTHTHTQTHTIVWMSIGIRPYTHTLFTLSLEHTLTHEPFCIALAVHPRGRQWLRTSHTHITNSHIQHANTCQNAKLRQTLWVAVLWAPLDKSWSLWVCVPFRMRAIWNPLTQKEDLVTYDLVICHHMRSGVTLFIIDNVFSLLSLNINGGFYRSYDQLPQRWHSGFWS